MAETQKSDHEIWARWDAEISFARKDPKYKSWLDRSEKIVRRYRDERNRSTESARRLNILWSNVETLKPAVFAKGPKPIVERRFMDRDPAARLASTILERCLSVQIETGYFFESVSHAVLDHLLPGMGQTWVRYEPQFEADEAIPEENAEIQAKERTAQEIEAEGDGTPYEKLAYERVCVDYVFYRDFLWGPARVWREVPWVDRISYLTHSEIAERFYDGDMEKARLVTLDFTPDRSGDRDTNEESISFFKKACIHEIWNKADQTVYFIAPGTPDCVLQVEKKPVLQLEEFWPCPPPLFATQTNDTLIPVPDYIEYQDQAQELDDLTGRIAALTTALRANGVYDASEKGLALLLQAGQDNKLVPIDNWAAFSEKSSGAKNGPIWLVPIKEIAEVLIGLYQARQQVKADLYEVTGMSDIVRGQGEKNTTATSDRIKGQFASMRLEDRRDRVNTFVRSIIRIMAEIISEMFSPETLLQMSGVDLMIQDEVRKAVEEVPPPPEPQLPPPPEGSPPIPPEQQQMLMQQLKAQGQQAFEQAKAQVAAAKQQEKMAEFQKAIEILKSDKLRGFRVDIETDSTIVSDAAADKEAASQLLAGTTEALTAMGPIVMQAPELMKPMGDLIMFAFRRFRVGRTVEASLEDALDQINTKIESNKGQPPPPSPEQIKAQAEQEKMKAEAAMDQQRFQLDMKEKMLDMQIEQQKQSSEMRMEQERNQMELQKMREELQLEREKMAIEREQMLTDAAVKEHNANLEIAVAGEQHEMQREAAREDHELGRQAARDKAAMAKKSGEKK